MRQCAFQLVSGDDRAKVRVQLVDALAVAIRQCLGDTEDDQDRRNSRIYKVWSELWLFGTEIEEWYGIGNLPKVIQNNLVAARELPDLMRRNSCSDDELGRAYYIIDSLESAATLALNEENWPTIKEHISSAANTIGLILHFRRFKLDQSSHDELVRRAAAMPAELDGHRESLQNGQFRRLDLENLAHELRTMAFYPLIRQHPQFVVKLEEISLHLRQHVLGWAKNTPKKDEAIDAIRDIGERLAQLIDKYGSP